ncbi:snurportin-1 protein [Salvia divinorum]|uniref:Snurportin-1 protein n=1 Tax=Salvia divinorum TaxID=28513 RepID=A0ABD1GDL6_SALDI
MHCGSLTAEVVVAGRVHRLKTWRPNRKSATVEGKDRAWKFHLMEMEVVGSILLLRRSEQILDAVQLDAIHVCEVLVSGDLLRFSINEKALCFKGGKLKSAYLNYLGKPNCVRAFVDSFLKVMLQYTARHSPLRIEHHLIASLDSPNEGDVGMVG